MGRRARTHPAVAKRAGKKLIVGRRLAAGGE
jgi:hypothetical protein